MFSDIWRYLSHGLVSWRRKLKTEPPMPLASMKTGGTTGHAVLTVAPPLTAGTTGVHHLTAGLTAAEVATAVVVASSAATAEVVTVTAVPSADLAGEAVTMTIAVSGGTEAAAAGSAAIAV